MSEPSILSVSELTRQIKELVEANFPVVWVNGEVSNCTFAASGHVYFTLKDDQAQLRAVIWRRTASRLKFELHDGLDVVAAGPVEVYQARGTYQLIVEQIVPRGIGALELAFRQLYEKLAAEGLFEPARKRPLPRFPRRIALVTSPTSAAVRDMLQVITRRWRSADVVILPVSVQGEGAAQEIAAAIRAAPKIFDVDVVIVGRGGGSLEDLWAFNEEVVARAIFACPIPVISAVGHEIDVSISDLVADRRALTPSEAGELVVPHHEEVRADLRRTRDRMHAALRECAAHARVRLDALASRRVFTRPLDRLHELTARLDELAAHIKRSTRHRLQLAQQQTAHLASALDALSPLNVLQRGYSITQRSPTGEVIRSADRVKRGDTIRTLLRVGSLTSRVETIDPAARDLGRPPPQNRRPGHPRRSERPHGE